MKITEEIPKKKIFFICPVRRPKTGLLKRLIEKILLIVFGTEDRWTKMQNAIKECIAQLEQEGNDVYWPARDTDQTDPVGFTICTTNRNAIKEVMKSGGKIYVWIDPQSQGSVFDIGIVFALLEYYPKTQIVIANRSEIQRTPYKSFQNVLLELSLRTRA